MKRKKTITAGRVVWSYIYSMPKPSDKGRARAEKLKCSTKARQSMNHRRATRELEQRLDCNFTEHDFKVELTYCDEFLPKDVISANLLVKKFLNTVRASRKKRNQILKYIYVTEGKHKRLHHHLVLSGSDIDGLLEFKSLWKYGIVEVNSLDSSRNYADLAEYLTKESRDDKTLNTRRFVCSLNLNKPIIENRYAETNETIDVPIGAIILENETTRNEYGEFIYYKYIIPKKTVKKKRKAENKKE